MERYGDLPELYVRSDGYPALKQIKSNRCSLRTPLNAGFFMSAYRASGVLLEAREEPLVKVMGGHIHERRKQSTIKGRGGAASLHAFYYRDVLGKHDAPGGVQALASRAISLTDGGAVGIQKLEPLPGPIDGF